MLSEYTRAISSVFNHAFTLLAGCVLTVLLGLYERFLRREPLPKRIYAWILVAFLVLACIMTIKDEQQNVTTLENEKAAISSSYNQCDRERDGKSLLADTYAKVIAGLQSSIANQQDTFNRCVVSLAENRKPQPLLTAIRRSAFQGATSGEAKYLTVLIGTTNKSIVPVKGVITCDGAMSFVGAGIAGENAIMTSRQGMLDDHRLHLGMLSAAWTPNRPLVIVVLTSQELNCSYKDD